MIWHNFAINLSLSYYHSPIIIYLSLPLYLSRSSRFISGVRNTIYVVHRMLYTVCASEFEWVRVRVYVTDNYTRGQEYLARYHLRAISIPANYVLFADRKKKEKMKEIKKERIICIHVCVCKQVFVYWCMWVCVYVCVQYINFFA